MPLAIAIAIAVTVAAGDNDGAAPIIRPTVIRPVSTVGITVGAIIRVRSRPVTGVVTTAIGRIGGIFICATHQTSRTNSR